MTPGRWRGSAQIRVTGQPPFSARHVGLIARFKPGDRSSAVEVDDLRRALDRDRPRLIGRGDARCRSTTGGVIDLAVKLEPAPMRTIAGELGYGTGEGLRAEASWQHRNFFNPEGALTVRGVVGTQEQLAARLAPAQQFPAARPGAQCAGARPAMSTATPIEAQDRCRCRPGFERQSNFIWQKKWTWSLGAELIATDERDTSIRPASQRRRTFFIGAIPGEPWL